MHKVGKQQAGPSAGLQAWPEELLELRLASVMLEAVRYADLPEERREELAKYQHGPHRSFETAGQTIAAMQASPLVDVGLELLLIWKEEEFLPEDLQNMVRGAAMSKLLDGFREVPASNDEFAERLKAVVDIPWIGAEGHSIARGWLPIFERLCPLLRDPGIKEDKSAWKTSQIKEKFGTLRWYAYGGEALQQAASLAEEISNFRCIACGKKARIHSDGWALNLCEEHIRWREAPRMTLQEQRDARDKLYEMIYLRS